MTMGLKTEKWYPTIGGLIVGLVAAYSVHLWGAPKGAKDLLTAYVGTSGILVGFLATAKTILLSIDSTRAVRILKRQGFYEILINYLVRAIYSGLALAVFSSVGVLIDWETWSHGSFILVFTFVWVWSSVHCGLATLRVIRTFKTLMVSNGKDDQP